MHQNRNQLIDVRMINFISVSADVSLSDDSLTYEENIYMFCGQMLQCVHQLFYNFKNLM